MVRLVRTGLMAGDWDKVDKAIKELDELYRNKYPQVKSVEYWYAVSGPINKLQLELTFDSLTDEDTWVTAVLKDDVYQKNMQILGENLTDLRDDLYRSWNNG